MGLEEEVERLVDKPAEGRWFVDRKEELKRLDYGERLYRGGIIGIASERGMGKTSFLKEWAKGRRALWVDVINRESKEGVLMDILHSLGEKVWKRKGKEWEVGIGYGGAGVRVKKHEEEEASLREVVKAIQKTLGSLRGVDVVILDEIDKQDKRELLLVLDAIKEPFAASPITLVVSLPAEMYREYYYSLSTAGEAHNLENALDSVLLLHPFSEEELVEIVERRSNLLKYVEAEARKALLEFADGNPRKFIRTLKEAGAEAVMEGKRKVSLREVEKVLARYVGPLMERAQLTPLEEELLMKIKEGSLAKAVEGLAKEGYSRPLLYKYVKRLAEKGLVRVEKGTIKLPGYVKALQRFSVTQ